MAAAAMAGVATLALGNSMVEATKAAEELTQALRLRKRGSARVPSRKLRITGAYIRRLPTTESDFHYTALAQAKRLRKKWKLQQAVAAGGIAAL